MTDNDKIIERIQQLLALAEDKGASENEATLAYEQAQRLMHKHSAEQCQLRNKDKQSLHIISKTIWIKYTPSNNDKADLARIVARANQCEIYCHCNSVNTILGIAFVGTEKDIEKTILLWQSMELYRASHWRKARRRKALDILEQNDMLDMADDKPTFNMFLKGIPVAGFRNGFYSGFQQRLKERFAELEDELNSTTTGSELVTTAKNAVNEYMSGMNIGSFIPRKRRIDAMGYDSGRDAAEHVGMGSLEVRGMMPRLTA